MIRSSTAKLPILIDRRGRRPATGPQVMRASSEPANRSAFSRSKIACRSWWSPGRAQVHLPRPARLLADDVLVVLDVVAQHLGRAAVVVDHVAGQRAHDPRVRPRRTSGASAAGSRRAYAAPRSCCSGCWSAAAPASCRAAGRAEALRVRARSCAACVVRRG